MYLKQVFYFILFNILIRYLLKNEKEPIFITLPSWRILKNQLSQELTFKMRVRFWFRILLSPLFLFLWNIDDLLFFKYKDIKIKNPVFILGGFRTGTTVVHRKILENNKNFVAPRLFEVMLPFLSIQYGLEFLEWIDFHYNSKFIQKLDNMVSWFCGDDVMKRHYMSYFNAEEDDLLLSMYLGVGWYNIIQYPFPELSLKIGQIQKLTRQEKYHIQYFYHYYLQKILFRRGTDKSRILCKSHLIDLIPYLKKNYKNSTFIYTHRDILDMKNSWNQLQNAAILQLHSQYINLENYNKDFWKLFFEDVNKYCGITTSFRKSCIPIGKATDYESCIPIGKATDPFRGSCIPIKMEIFRDSSQEIINFLNGTFF